MNGLSVPQKCMHPSRFLKEGVLDAQAIEIYGTVPGTTAAQLRASLHDRLDVAMQNAEMRLRAAARGTDVAALDKVMEECSDKLVGGRLRTTPQQLVPTSS